VTQPEDAAELAVVAALEQIHASGRADVRDRMTVAALLKEDGKVDAADWCFDYPRRYARLISGYGESVPAS